MASKPPEARKRQGRIPLRISEGPWPCQHLDFGFLASRNTRQHISVILNHPVCGALLRQPQEIHAGILLVFFYCISVVISKLWFAVRISNGLAQLLTPPRQLSESNVSQCSSGTPVLKKFWMVLKHCIWLLKQIALLRDTSMGLKLISNKMNR